MQQYCWVAGRVFQLDFNWISSAAFWAVLLQKEMHTITVEWGWEEAKQKKKLWVPLESAYEKWRTASGWIFPKGRWIRRGTDTSTSNGWRSNVWKRMIIIITVMQRLCKWIKLKRPCDEELNASFNAVLSSLHSQHRSKQQAIGLCTSVPQHERTL